MKLLESTLASVPIARPIPTEERPQGLCLDRGYDYDEVRELALGQRLEPHIRTRGEELELKERHPDWRARRWVVEACHSWLNRNRAILIRWSKKDENHLALLQLIWTTFRPPARRTRRPVAVLSPTFPSLPGPARAPRALS